ncbi:hypothetical protein DOTSEDRAFT_25897 [Dothistroma septosporum NZE10]|uniref:Glycoside hydrolase family 28 protein n=1 Tax=Dothistroma septosporum (strain NZE10 / CBS 128990) TaxID=675120 RepID=N1PJH6_DOTSN|nr:hypothetical protein DOTSEDRAFT_25897 [Dothistroma septosporum NZE10]
MGNIISTSCHCFKTLQLPAELRNEIYFLALTHDRQTGSRATSALLLTGREVYAEAVEVLYAQSTLSMGVAPCHDYWFKDRAVTLTNDIRYRDKSYGQSMFCPSSGISRPLPIHTLKIWDLHLHPTHSPYYQGPISENSGCSSDTHGTLVKLVKMLGQDENLPREIAYAFMLQLYTGAGRRRNSPALVNLELMFEPLYTLTATTKIEVYSHTFAVPVWAKPYVSAPLSASINKGWDRISRNMQTLTEHDVLPRIAYCVLQEVHGSNSSSSWTDRPQIFATSPSQTSLLTVDGLRLSPSRNAQSSKEVPWYSGIVIQGTFEISDITLTNVLGSIHASTVAINQCSGIAGGCDGIRIQDVAVKHLGSSANATEANAYRYLCSEADEPIGFE